MYARRHGSIAAPTAGLHFTPELLARIPHAFVTLHVGAGTFRPVQVDDLSQHRMHAEQFSLPAETAAACNAAKRLFAFVYPMSYVIDYRITDCTREGATVTCGYKVGFYSGESCTGTISVEAACLLTSSVAEQWMRPLAS